MGQQLSTRNARKHASRSPAIGVGRHLPPEPSVEHPDPRTADDDVQSPQEIAPARPRKARSLSQSFRKSVVGLVKPRPTSTVVDDSSLGNRWRRSRRWSKAPEVELASDVVHPENDGEDVLESVSPDNSDNTTAANQTFPVASANLDNSSSSPIAPSVVKLDDSTSFSSTSISNDASPRGNLAIVEEEPSHPATDKGGDESIASSVVHDSAPTLTSQQNSLEQESALPAGQSSTSNSAQSQASPSVQSPPPSTSQESAPRPEPVVTPGPAMNQFPPAGALVIVQGVVHTSETGEIPSTAASAARNTPSSFNRSPSRPRTPNNRRSGLLSNLLRRRNSTGSLTSPSAGDSSNLDSASFDSTEETIATAEGVVDGSTSVGSSDATGSQATNISNSVPFSSNPTSPSTSTGGHEGGSQRGQLSSNSLDVLGALLSVATAATAASLLAVPTGGPVGRGASPNATLANPPTGIPSLARALANVTPPTANPVRQDQESDRAEHERNRVRNIWEGLRERLAGHGRPRQQQGLPTTPEGDPSLEASTVGTSSTPSLAQAQNRPTNDSAITDSLFNELAQAFNLTPPPPPDPHEEMRNHVPFEEQFDRVQSGDAPIPGNEQIPPPSTPEEAPPGSFERFLIDLQIDLRAALARSDVESASPVQSESRRADEQVAAAEEHSTTSPSDDSMPPLLPTQGVPGGEGSSEAGTGVPSSNDGTSDHQGGGADSSGIDGTPSQVPSSDGSAQEGRTNSSFGTTTSQPGRGGISWWRSYRFPPIRLNRPTSTAQMPSAQGTTPTNADVSPTPDELNAAAIPGVAPAVDASQPQPTNLVVPVIVVGLQSVNIGPTRTQQGTQTQEPPPSEDGNNTEAHVTATPQDRWQSRAARAIGRLGQSRRAETAANGNVPAAEIGSRTFFIYVFGGYYPPNHHMVTGPETLDSFEALRELAELLGQMKSPTATDTEIERSGLEVFKAKSLSEYEREGRVASNCVDRCLICLDDYDSEDDLRLLTCKHSFHKACVDHWLKTGRNNCPACRGAGVKTGNDSSSANRATTSA